MLIIDTYNVLHAIEGLGHEAASLDVPSLGRLIASSRHAKTRCLLVCDGNRGQSGPIPGAPNVYAKYVGTGRDADSAIEDILASHSAARRMLVISSDHRIQRAAEKRRAKWVESRAFLEQIIQDSNTSRPEIPTLSAADEHEMMRAFGVDPEEIEARRRAEKRESTGDPTLDEAIDHFDGRINPEDLDMSKWLDGKDL